MIPRVSIVVTAYNEGEEIVAHLERLLEAVMLPCEVIVVCDSSDDSSIRFVEKVMSNDPRISVVINEFGRGPARAIRYGFSCASAPVVVVTMADGCDDPYQIDQLARLVERGVVIAAASRYARGGQAIGAPFLKGLMSKMAGVSLKILANVGTWDATNSFKAYSKAFVEEVGIESDAGFEVGLELVAKARRMRKPVAEIPTIWLERTGGESKFRVLEWLPRYMKWYFHAFGRDSEKIKNGRNGG